MIVVNNHFIAQTIVVFLLIECFEHVIASGIFGFNHFEGISKQMMAFAEVGLTVLGLLLNLQTFLATSC